MKYVIGGVIAFIALVLGVFLYQKGEETPSFLCAHGALVARFDEYTFMLDIADTTEKRMRGLSGREELSQREGMFFVFPHIEIQGFWMKDMHFPIHILWIDEQFVIRGAVEKADPLSYPNIFYSPIPVSYVLEVHADSVLDVKKHIGTQIQFTCMQKPAV